MYTITQRLNGTFDVSCMIQDGYEEYNEPTRDKAIASLIGSAKYMNGATITEKDIRFYVERSVAVPATEVVQTVEVPRRREIRTTKFVPKWARTDDPDYDPELAALFDDMPNIGHCEYESSPEVDVGPAKYPPGLKGLLLRLADKL